jgi:hypothetical protein
LLVAALALQITNGVVAPVEVQAVIEHLKALLVVVVQQNPNLPLVKAQPTQSQLALVVLA